MWSNQQRIPENSLTSLTQTLPLVHLDYEVVYAIIMSSAMSAKQLWPHEVITTWPS